MAKAKMGDIVKVHYTGRLDDETVFDSSVGREPLQFVLGEGMLLHGFEQAVTGLEPGQSRTVKIPAAEAYGERVDEMVVDFQRSQFPAGFEPRVGYQIHLKDENEGTIPAMIVNVTDTTVTLDGNHPLAGQDLTFDIQLLEILGKGQLEDSL